MKRTPRLAKSDMTAFCKAQLGQIRRAIHNIPNTERAHTHLRLMIRNLVHTIRVMKLADTTIGAHVPTNLTVAAIKAKNTVNNSCNLH